MKFEEVLPALRAGKKVRRAAWSTRDYIVNTASCDLTMTSIIADDWEIMPEKVKKTVWVNVFQGQHGFVTDGIHDSRVEAAQFSCRHFLPHLGAHPITVEVDE
jgi:hypothetical protein